MIKKILGFIPFILILSFSSCIVFGDIYCTYELEGINSQYQVNSGLYSEYKAEIWDIIELNGKDDVRLRIDFEEKGSIPMKKGYFLGNPYERINNTEPYDMGFIIRFKKNIFDYTDKIIFNEMLLQAKNNNIDLREKVSIEFSGKRHREKMEGEKFADYITHEFKEEELIDFRSSGIIDFSKYKNEWEKIYGMYIEYNNVNVVFKKDPYFTVKLDINFEGTPEPQHYNFIVKLIRKKFTEWVSWLAFFKLLFEP